MSILTKPRWMDSDLEMFRDSVQKFVQAEVVPNDKAWKVQQYMDKSLWLKAGQMGFLCTDIPEEYGGMGVDFRHEAIMAEEFWGKAITPLTQWCIHSSPITF